MKCRSHLQRCAVRRRFSSSALAPPGSGPSHPSHPSHPPVKPKAAHFFEGRCLCGGVTVRLQGSPTFAPAYCHCNHCRLFHGAPFAMEAGWPTHTCQISGNTTVYKTSKAFERHRCAVCGTPSAGLHKRLGAAFVPTTLLVEPGLLALPLGLQPTMHLFYSRRIVGETFAADGLPKHDGMPPS